MMQQLFIGGVLADINEDTDVLLSIKSNLLNGAADFTGNSSLTITLPSTLHNRNLIGHADIVQGVGTVPYRFHNVDYYRDGVQLIRGGVGRLMSANPDTIEIAITWGVRVAVDGLLNADETLNDITTNAAIEFNASPVLSTYAEALVDEVFYASIDTIRYAGENEFMHMHVTMGGAVWDVDDILPASSYLHPSVRMNWLTGKLTAKYGTSFNWGAEQSYIDTMIVPLITKIPNDITYNGGYKCGVHEPASWGTGGDNFVRFTTTQSSVVMDDVTNAIQLTCAQAFNGLFRFQIYFYIKKADLIPVSAPIYKLKYGYRIIVSVTNTQNNTNVNRYCTLIPENYYINGNIINSADQIPVYVTGYLPVDFNNVGDFATMFVGCVYNGVYDQSLNAEIHIMGGNITINEITADDNAVQPGQLYPVAGNLPDIKPIELVKFLCAVTGTFPVQASTDDTLIFKPVASVFDWSVAVDWSDKVRSKTDRPVASNIEYTVDGWAQRNMWRWKEDDTVKNNYDGGIDVDDDALEESRDIMTFPFAATDGNNVPMYDQQDVKWEKVEPRVLRMFEDEDGNAGAVFDMAMDTIIADKYQYLGITMNHPVVIRETIRISDVELAAVDETKAIYLKQHGAYFALLELTSKGKGMAEVKLLKLSKETT